MKNMKVIKQMLLVFALMTAAITLFAWLPVAGAAFIDDSVAPKDISTEGLSTLVVRMVNYALTFLGLVAIIIVIYGGITYVTSAGNDDKVGTAKKMIMYAMIGIIIILLSYALVNTVLGAGTPESPITQ